jgi:hypothetical protein
MSVPAAGKKYFGLERAASYNAAKTGMIPTIRIGRKLRALPVAIERMLEQKPLAHAIETLGAHGRATGELRHDPRRMGGPIARLAGARPRAPALSMSSGSG